MKNSKYGSTLLSSTLNSPLFRGGWWGRTIRALEGQFLLALFLLLVVPVMDATEPVRVGIAWQRSVDNYDRVIHSITAAGGEPVILPQLRPAGWEYEGVNILPTYLGEHGMLLQPWADQVKRDTWHGTNADEALQGVQAVVFLGGGDVCPTLFATPQTWHGIAAEGDHDATRDVSEYLTMAYCLDHDIPVLGLCRGMQLLGVVSGAPLIQDLPTYYSRLGKTDHYVHRSDYDYEGNRHYSPHDVVVTNRRSLLWSIVHTDTIHGAPSWHHQAVGDVTGTPLRVTGVAEHDGVTVIEAIERPDKRWVLGVQFHPETAVRKHLHHEDDEHRFMSLRQGLAYFRALIQAAASSQAKE